MTNVSALIDIGGSSIKVTICDINTEKIYSHEVSTSPKVEGRHIYLEPNYLFTNITEAMNACAKKLPPGLLIDNLYISTLRQGFCLVQGAEEVTPLYLNSDSSGEYARKDIENYGSERLYEETGHWFAPQLTLPKVINLLQIKPKLFDKRTKLLFVHDWLVWRLTNILLTEMTLVSAGQLAKLKESKAHTELLDYFRIPVSLLPDPQKFGTSLGKIIKGVRSELTPHWRETMLYVGGGDSHFLHMGSSGNLRGKVVVSAGSSTPISLLSPELGTSTTLKPWKSTSFVETDYLLEGNLGYPGSFYGWLQSNVSNPPSLQRVDIETVSRAPIVFGSCNMWNEKKWESRPAFSIMGDFSNSSSSDLALGLTLDYAYSLANQISALDKDGFDIDTVIITGGGANAQIQSILNSLLEKPVDLISTDNAVRNLFLILNGMSTLATSGNSEPEILDKETSEFLKERSRRHSFLYEQVEDTRKVLENAG